MRCLPRGRALGRKIVVLEVRYSDFDAAFADLVEQRADALIVGTFTLFRSPQKLQPKSWSWQRATGLRQCIRLVSLLIVGA